MEPPQQDGPVFDGAVDALVTNLGRPRQNGETSMEALGVGKR